MASEIREDHASYLAHWLTVLKADKRAIFTAASQAQKAADYLHGLSPNLSPSGDQIFASIFTGKPARRLAATAPGRTCRTVAVLRSDWPRGLSLTAKDVVGGQAEFSDQSAHLLQGCAVVALAGLLDLAIKFGTLFQKFFVLAHKIDSWSEPMVTA